MIHTALKMLAINEIIIIIKLKSKVIPYNIKLSINGFNTVSDISIAVFCFTSMLFLMIEKYIEMHIKINT